MDIASFFIGLSSGGASSILVYELVNYLRSHSKCRGRIDIGEVTSPQVRTSRVVSVRRMESA
jgi:hypothetical protein